MCECAIREKVKKVEEIAGPPYFLPLNGWPVKILLFQCNKDTSATSLYFNFEYLT